MDKPSKVIVTHAGAPGAGVIETVEETDAQDSVELGETAPDGKGAPYVKSVKAYANNVADAGAAAMAELNRERESYGRPSKQYIAVPLDMLLEIGEILAAPVGEPVSEERRIKIAEWLTMQLAAVKTGGS